MMLSLDPSSESSLNPSNALSSLPSMMLSQLPSAKPSNKPSCLLRLAQAQAFGLDGIDKSHFDGFLDLDATAN
jgi:hypothetical protein